MHLLRALSIRMQCKGYRLCKQHAHIAIHVAGSAARAHLLHPVCARGQINQQAKKLVSLLAVSLAGIVNTRSQLHNLPPRGSLSEYLYVNLAT